MSLIKRVFRLRSKERSQAVSLLVALFALAALALLVAGPVGAQTQQQQPQQPASSQQQKPQLPSAGEAGGPGGDTGSIAIPKKKDAEPAPPTPRKPPEKEPQFTMTVDVPLVTLDVLVTTKDGQFVPGLKKDMFRVSEDGVPQKITNFGQAEAPITAVLLLEFSSQNYGFMNGDVLNAAYTFAQTLKKNDWVAVVAYDMKPEILADFTQDKGSVLGALNRLRIPGFRETNMFDAMYDTLDRVDGIEGRKYVVLVSSGFDSFSKITYDTIQKKIKATPNVTIFPIDVSQPLRLYAESRGMLGALTCSGFYSGGNITNMDYLQGENEMNTFARMTGGKAYFPRFAGELPEIFNEVAHDIRNEYVLGYHPTNTKLDGTYRKLKIELVAADGSGQPLKVKDQKGKDLKVQIIARDGYTAKHTVE